MACSKGLTHYTSAKCFLSNSGLFVQKTVLKLLKTLENDDTSELAIGLGLSLTIPTTSTTTSRKKRCCHSSSCSFHRFLPVLGIGIARALTNLSLVHAQKLCEYIHACDFVFLDYAFSFFHIILWLTEGVTVAETNMFLEWCVKDFTNTICFNFFT